MKRTIVFCLVFLLGIICKAQSLYPDNSFGQCTITYSPTQSVAKSGGSKESETYNTLEIEFGSARKISDAIPVGLYFGVAPSFTFYNDSDTSYGSTVDVSTFFASVKINLGLVGEISLLDNCSVRPYAGFVPLAHCAAISKSKIDGKENSKVDLLSKKDMGDCEYNWFVLDWKIGLTFKINNLLIGYHYEAPITNLYKEGDVKYNMYYHNISFGFNFK